MRVVVEERERECVCVGGAMANSILVSVRDFILEFLCSFIHSNHILMTFSLSWPLVTTVPAGSQQQQQQQQQQQER